MAALTLRELERWLTLAVGTYHGSVHNGLLQPPAARWAEAITRTGVPTVITRATAFLVDFLPIIRRTLTRTGFVIDHIHYYADALKPWIARATAPAFLIRRDPRDISPYGCWNRGQHYLEIPYRTLSHPAVTLWEQRQALAKLRQQGREQVDESALFRMIGQMREIVTTAQKAARKARRDADRRQHLKATAPPVKTTPPPGADMDDPQADNQPPAKPFDQIEEWWPWKNIPSSTCPTCCRRPGGLARLPADGASIAFAPTAGSAIREQSRALNRLETPVCVAKQATHAQPAAGRPDQQRQVDDRRSSGARIRPEPTPTRSTFRYWSCRCHPDRR